MRNAVITAVFLGMMLFDGAVLQKDVIFKGRINIKSKTGELKGWMKKDLLLPNRINAYDKYGNKRQCNLCSLPLYSLTKLNSRRKLATT